MNTDVMFSSATDKWATPQDFFDKLNDEFHFTLDAAADQTNHKCDNYYDESIDGLSQPWSHTHTQYGVTHLMVGKLVHG